MDLQFNKNNIFVNSICYKTDLIRKSGLQWTEKVFYSDNEYDYFPSKIAKTIRFVDIPVYVYWIGREGQSVGPDTLLKNYRSFQLVGTKILEDFWKQLIQKVIYTSTKNIFW